jgi:hypothetical protein
MRKKLLVLVLVLTGAIMGTLSPKSGEALECEVYCDDTGCCLYTCTGMIICS